VVSTESFTISPSYQFVVPPFAHIVALASPMAFNATNVSALTQGLSEEDNWRDFEDLVDWNGDLHDTFFQSDPEQLHDPLVVTSTIHGSTSDYATSASQLGFEGPSSSGQGHSWLSASPSYTTTATSPLICREESGHNGPFSQSSFGPTSFDVCGDHVSHLSACSIPPFPDTQHFGSSNSYQTASAPIFNPHLATSPFAFNGLDVSASQAFMDVDTCVQPASELYQELNQGGAMPIPIPRGGNQSSSNLLSAHSWEEDLPSRHVRTKAISIPQPDHTQSAVQRQRARRVSTRNSASPETKRLPRSAPLMRSMSNSSKNDPSRSRNRLSSASPTPSHFSWVSYQPNAQTNRLVPSSTDWSRGKRPKGRTGALTAEQRSHAALMRRVVSCSNCKRRKEKCDAGVPCKSCLDHYGGNLVNHPCRDFLLSDLSGAFLPERLGWHPTARAIESFLPSNSYSISVSAYLIPLYFGFGPALHLSVNPMHVKDTLCHEHIIYAWPPSTSSKEVHTHAVLPAVLTPEANSTLYNTLDEHLSLLVRQHFRAFPLYCSPLSILRDIYVLYRTLPTAAPSSHLLEQALKLLALVHIGGDITLPSPNSDTHIEQLIHETMSFSGSTTPTPCFIRAQFGSVMPALALSLMKEVLSTLELLFLKRESCTWPVSLATLVVVLMIVESIQYHAAKLPYHHFYDGTGSQENDNKIDDEGVKSLLAFYSTCFAGSHTSLNANWQIETTVASQPTDTNFSATSPEDRFMRSVQEAINEACSENYLESKATAERVDDDMGFFFDRLAARLLLLKP
jgi:hypothetical protein